MNRKTNLIPALLLSALSLYAMEDVKVTQFQHAGPFTVNKPILADSLNVNGKPFEAKNLLKATLPFEQTLANATVLDADTAGAITFAAPQKGYALHLFSFFLNSDRYVKGTLDISGPGAVSYTHLDVYKRQVLCREVGPHVLLFLDIHQKSDRRDSPRDPHANNNHRR